jgi:hypothetical protein
MRHGQGNRVRYRLVAAALLVAAIVAGPARASDGPSAWRAVDAATGRIADVPGLEQLARDFPDSASVRRRLLGAYLEAGQDEAALREAVALVEDGYAFSSVARERILALGPSAAQASALAGQDANAEPRAGSRTVATIPADFALVESVWRDPATHDLFATTVVSRTLIVSRAGGAWTEILLSGAGSLSGIAHDQAAGLLWVASGVFEQTPQPDTAFRGLIALDPRTGLERRRVAAPAGATPSDIAVGPAGEVYASDPLSGAIYLAPPGADRLRTLVEPGIFRSPQGIAPLADGRRIVVSDYAYGLAVLNADGTGIRRLALDAPATLDGIDGLWRLGDRLVGMQNGARPMRIVELVLGPDQERIDAVVSRETANPAWTEPVGGALSGDSLVYVATGQWDRFGPDGTAVEGASPQPTEIRALPIGQDAPPLP